MWIFYRQNVICRPGRLCSNTIFYLWRFVVKYFTFIKNICSSCNFKHCTWPYCIFDNKAISCSGGISFVGHTMLVFNSRTEHALCTFSAVFFLMMRSHGIAYLQWIQKINNRNKSKNKRVYCHCDQGHIEIRITNWRQTGDTRLLKPLSSWYGVKVTVATWISTVCFSYHGRSSKDTKSIL